MRICSSALRGQNSCSARAHYKLLWKGEHWLGIIENGPLETSTQHPLGLYNARRRPWLQMTLCWRSDSIKNGNYLILSVLWQMSDFYFMAKIWKRERPGHFDEAGGFALASHFERLKTSNIGSRLGRAFHMGGCAPGAHILSPMESLMRLSAPPAAALSARDFVSVPNLRLNPLTAAASPPPPPLFNAANPRLERGSALHSPKWIPLSFI